MSSNGQGKKRRIMIITADESIIEQIQNSNNSALFKTFVLDSQIDDIDLSYAKNIAEIHSSTPKKARAASLNCVVCGSIALGYNFDAITCESCKAFFRRNALKDSATFQCRRAGMCEINIDTRRRCSSCRLNKCLKVGMKADRLLNLEEKVSKRRNSEEHRKLNAVPISHTPEQTTEQICIFDDETNRQLVTTDVEPVRKSKRGETRRALMSTDDLKSLETIQYSYDKRFELAASFLPPWNPSEYTDTLLQNINARSILATRLLMFFKQIPEFNQIDVDDKVVLIKYNLMPLVTINGTIWYKLETDQVIEVETDIPWNTSTMKETFGNEIFERVKKNFDRFVSIAQFDRKIILLTLVILIFTRVDLSNLETPEPMLKEPIAVYKAQSFYTELLWKYMETVHGMATTTRIFSQLVTCFVSWKSLDEKIRYRIKENLRPNETDFILPIMKSLLNIA